MKRKFNKKLFAIIGTAILTVAASISLSSLVSRDEFKESRAGESTDAFVFTNKNLAYTLNGAAGSTLWSGDSASSFESASPSRGLAFNKVNATFTCNTSYSNINRIDYVWSTNKAKDGKLEVKVGGETISTKNPSGSAVQNETVEVADLNLSGKVSFTVTATTDKTIYVKSVTIYVKSGETVHVNGVTLDKTSLKISEGESAQLSETITPSNADDKSVSWSSSNESCATVINGLVTGVSAGTATITVKTNDGNFTASCAVTVKEAEKFELVTGTSDLVAGAQYIIVDNGKTKAMSTTQNANNRSATSISVVGNQAIINPSVQILTLGGDKDGWTLSTGDDGYLYAAGGTGSNNYLKTSPTLTGPSYWSISFDDGGHAVIKTTDTTVARHTIFNNNNLFSCYASGQTSVFLYWKPVEAQEFDVTTNLLNVTFDGASTAIEREPYEGTFTIDEHYTLTSDDVEVLMNNVDITDTAYNESEQTIDIDSVTGPIEITALATIDKVNIDQSGLLHVSSSFGGTQVDYGAKFEATLTADTGYNLNEANVVVTMGGVDVTDTAYSAQTHKVVIEETTGNVVISATGNLNSYTVTIPDASSHIVCENDDTSVNHFIHYQNKLRPDVGYTLDGANITVTMGGVDITATAYDESTNEIDINSVTGAIVISGNAQEVGEPSMYLDTDDLIIDRKVSEIGVINIEYANVLGFKSHTITQVDGDDIATFNLSEDYKTLTVNTSDVGSGMYLLAVVVDIAGEKTTELNECFIVEATEVYNVTKSLTNVSWSFAGETVDKYEKFEAELFADSGYFIEESNVSVLMGADVKTGAFDPTTNKITIDSVTDDIYVTVTATKIAVQSIVANTDGMKKYFSVGSEFDPTGILVTAKLNHGDDFDVTNFVTYSDVDMTTAGEKTITVSYKEGEELPFTTDITINVCDITKDTIALSGKAIAQKDGDTWDLSGVSAKLVFGPKGSEVEELLEKGDDKDYTVTTTQEVTIGCDNLEVAVHYHRNGVTKDVLCSVTETAVMAEVVDVLNREFTGIAVGTNYGEWSGKTGNSGAVYAGNSAGANDTLQLRSSNSNSGVIQTKSAGNVVRFSLRWAADTSDGRKVDVFGKNTPYSSPTELYNDLTKGTKIGTIEKGEGKATTLDITGNYAYIGIRSNSGALYLTDVSITILGGEAANLQEVTIDKNEHTQFLKDVTDNGIQLPEGAKVTALFDDESTLDVTELVTPAPDRAITEEGDYTITLTYGTGTYFKPKSCTYILHVVDGDKIASIDEVTPAKTVFLNGEDFTSEGLVVKGTTKSGDKVTITNYDLDASAYVKDTDGKYSIKVSIDGVERSYEVTVCSVTAITLSKATDIGWKGDEFYYSGTVTASFTQGVENRILNNDEVTFSGYDMSTLGEQEVTATYGCKSVTYTLNVKDPDEVTDFRIDTTNVKKVYFLEDGLDLDLTGLEAYTRYARNPEQEVSVDLDKLTIDQGGFDKDTAGTYTITVSYGGKDATFDVVVKADAIVSILLNEDSTVNTDYLEGDEFDPEGLIIDINYESGKKETVSYEGHEGDFSFDPEDALTTEDEAVTVTYGDKYFDLPVTVSEKVITDVEIKSGPSITSYTLGDQLNLSGMVVTVTYNESREVDFAYNELPEGVTVTPAQGTVITRDTAEIVVSAGELSDSFELTIIIPVTSVELNKTELTLDINGEGATLVATITPEDATNKDVTWTSSDETVVTVTNGVITIVGKGEAIITVTTSDGALTATCNVEVVKKELASIEVSNQKTEYFVGDDFIEPTVTATYNNEETKDVSEDATFSGYDMSIAGKQTVTVRYTEGEITKECTYEITVTAVVPTGITIEHQANKLEFDLNEDFTYEGLTIKVTYNNKDTIVISSGFTVSTPDMTTEGQKTVTVTYSEGDVTKTCEYTITVTKVIKIPTGITVEPAVTEFKKGDTFVGPESAHITYADGSEDDVTNIVVTGYNMEKVGTQTVTVSYTENDVTVSTTYEITIAANDPTPLIPGCGGNIVITSVILSSLALLGVALILIRKRKDQK